MKVISGIHIVSVLLIWAPLSGIKALNSFESMPVTSSAKSLQSVSQQQKQVSGIVTDAETQEPLIGVSVKVKGTNIATVTDLNGNYHLTWTNKSSTLVFSYIGKKTVEVSANGRNTINVVSENIENTLSEITLIPERQTMEVTTTLTFDNPENIDYIEITKIGGTQFTENVNISSSTYIFKYKSDENDPEKFSFAVIGHTKDGNMTPPMYLQVDNRKGMFINKVMRVARITGAPMEGETLPSPNETVTKWNVGGTDLGIIWELTPGKYGLFFGDTFGADFRPNAANPGPNGTSWRSNVLAFSEDTDLDDGLTVKSMATDNSGKAREIVHGGKDGSGKGDLTSIPTAAIRANGIDYVHYMNIRNWEGWITNYSGIYKSTDNGQTWKQCQSVKFSGESNFSMAAYYKKDGYVYMLGTKSGRTNPAYLARFKETNMENQSAYEYWNGDTKIWVQGDESKATVLLPGTVGEASIIYNEYFCKWIVAYFNETNYNISMQYADDITGPWSEPLELASGRDYAQLYGSYFHPISAKGRNLYFAMSMWLPYNTFLMKVELGGIGN